MMSNLLAIHAISMALGWLILVPLGVWLSSVGRRQYPAKWACYHGTVMGVATVIIFIGIFCAHKAIDEHFNDKIDALAPALHGLLLVQAVVGLVIYSRRGEVGTFVPKAHRALGLVLYLGGLINGTLGIYAYGKAFACVNARYILAMLGGVMASVHFYLMCHILPAWWKDMKTGTSYEPLIGEE